MEWVGEAELEGERVGEEVRLAVTVGEAESVGEKVVEAVGVPLPPGKDAV